MSNLLDVSGKCRVLIACSVAADKSEASAPMIGCPTPFPSTRDFPGLCATCRLSWNDNRKKMRSERREWQ